MIEQRLIDANRLSQEMCQRFPFPNGAVADDVMAIINNAPTVDAVAVAHAKWVKDDTGSDSRICSNCLVVALENEDWEPQMTPYCPNCGAKMEGGE